MTATYAHRLTSGVREVVARAGPSPWALVVIGVAAYRYLDHPAATRSIVMLFAAAVLTLTAPFTLLLGYVAGLFVTRRVQPGGIDMSIADAALIAAVPAGLLLLRRFPMVLKPYFLAAALYQLFLILVLVAHPTEAAIVDWGHRALLTGGSLIVGAAIAGAGYTRIAFRIFVAVCAVVSAVAVLQTISSGFVAAYPLGLHKNGAGFYLGLALLLWIPSPKATGITGPLRATWPLVIAGLAATQARGAIAAMLIVSVLWMFGTGRLTRRALALALCLLVFPFVIYAATAREERLLEDDPAAYKFSSTGTRALAIESAWDFFIDSPIAGQGVRFFYSTGRLEPHNAVVTTLAETGVVGLTGTVLLFGLTIRGVRQGRSPLTGLALAVLAFKLIESQFQLLWVAGTASIPWLIVGLVAYDRATADASPAEPKTVAAV